jgi:hypothetical protein
MLIWHDSKFAVRRAQSSRVRKFNRTIFDIIHDNKDYMEEDRTSVYRLPTCETNILPYDMSTGSISNVFSHHSRVVYKLQSLLVGAGSRKAFTHRVQVSSGIEGL